MAIDDGGLHSATQSKIQVPEKRYALDGLVPVSELMGKVDTLTRRVEELEAALAWAKESARKNNPKNVIEIVNTALAAKEKQS